MTTIVVGYRPDPEGEAALRTALEQAALRPSSLHVVQHVPVARSEDTVEYRSQQQAVATAREGMEQRLADVEPPAHGIVQRLLTDPDSSASGPILRLVDQVDADLLVIGMRRRSRVGKLVLGSVAQELLLDAPCDVLAVKAPAPDTA